MSYNLPRSQKSPFQPFLQPKIHFPLSMLQAPIQLLGQVKLQELPYIPAAQPKTVKFLTLRITTSIGLNNLKRYEKCRNKTPSKKIK